jgi:hypothetical protein
LPDDWGPEDFGPDSQAAQIAAGWSRLEFERELEKFRSHHEAVGSRFANWQKAWANWVIKSAEIAERGGGGGQRQSGASSNASFIDIALAEAEAAGGKRK